MEETKKAKIVSSKYDEERDMVIWRLLFDDGTEQAFCWPSIDLMTAWNIKGKIEIHHVHEFCNVMLGKQINWVLRGQPSYEVPEIKEEQYRKISSKIEEHFDTFRKEVE